MAINSNIYRYLYRDVEGYFRVKGSGPSTVGGVCSGCGIRENCQEYIRHHAMNVGNRQRIEKCEKMIPGIIFEPPIKGVEDEFNTIRLGSAWAARVGPGSKVALASSKGGEVVGFAEVTGVTVASLDEVIDQHSHRNHNVKEVSDQAAAQKIMRERIRRRFGRMMTAKSVFTVMDLKRLH